MSNIQDHPRYRFKFDYHTGGGGEKYWYAEEFNPQTGTYQYVPRSIAASVEALKNYLSSFENPKNQEPIYWDGN